MIESGGGPKPPPAFDLMHIHPTPDGPAQHQPSEDTIRPFGLERFLARTGEAVGAGILLSLLTMLVFSILARDVLRIPTPWLEEIATLMAVYAVAFASIGAWSRGAHIAIEIVPMLLPPKVRRRLQFVILCLSFAFLVLAASGAAEMMDRSAFNRTTALGLSFTIYYAGLLAGFGGMAFLVIFQVGALISGRRTAAETKP